MSLPSELLSEFVKVTNDKTEIKEETTVFGTIKEHEGRTYVKLDGSELLTPITSTTVVKDGERVTVMIKNHTATVTGNVTSPSAQNKDLSGLADDIDVQANKITEFEIAVGYRVSAEEITAINAVIDSLKTKVAKFGDIITVNAEIERLRAEYANLDYVYAKEAEILNATIDRIQAHFGDFDDITVEELTALNADIDQLKAYNADFTYVHADVLKSIKASIKDLDVDNITAMHARIVDLDADEAEIALLKSDVADINTLIFGSATGDTLQTSFANSVIAQLGEAQIKSAMIESVAAGKITAGDIITNNVRVRSDDGSLLISDETIQISDNTRVRVQIGKDAANDYSINIWDADGNLMFSQGGITDSAIKEAIIRNDMVSDTANISAHKLDIDSLFEEINGSKNTIKSTKVLLDDENQTLDVAFKSMITEVSELGETVSSQGTQISTVQGQITSKVWQQDISEATSEMSTQYSTLDQKVDGVSATVAEHTSQISKKAESSAVATVSDKVSKLETNLSGFKSTVSETYATKTEVGELEVGGRNLIRNGSFTSDSSKWSFNADTNTFVHLPNGGYGGDGALELTVTTAGTVVPRQATSFHFAAGTTLTCSVKVKEIEGSWSTAYVRWANLYSIFYTYHKPLEDGWTLYVYTTTLTEDLTTAASNTFGFAGMGVGTFIVDDIKLERGNKATDWTAAPEDIEGEFSRLETKLSDAETIISQNTEAIGLTATKTEVTTAKNEAISSANNNTANLLKDYTKTSEMEAALEVSAEGIVSSVSQTYATKTELNELEIGGRNLLRNSSFTDGTSKWSVSANAMTLIDGYSDDGLQLVIDTPTTVTPRQAVSITLKAGDSLTCSAKVKVVEGDFSGYQIRFAGLFTLPLVETKPITDEWTLYVYRATAGSDMEITSSNAFGFAYGAVGTYIIDELKLERGDKATDWSPAPEDMATGNDIASVNDSIEKTDERVSKSETLIQQLSESIMTLVTDGNGESLMVQTETGWTFSTGSISEAVDAASEALDSLTNEMGDVNTTVDVLKQAVDDLGVLNDYVKITTYETEPCIELGENDSDFKLLITNTRIMFMQGSNVPAYISNQSLYIKKAVVEEELQQGEFVWKARSNGNLGLMWKGVSS